MAKNTQNIDSDGTDVTLSDKKENFLKALKANSGNIAESCRSINISRQTYYRWKKDKKFEQDCIDAEESLLDFAESQLQELIKSKNPIAILFFLKTKGKGRGYDETHKVQIDKPFDRIELEGI